MNQKKEPLLQMEDISISFGGLKALNGVGIEVYPQEIMAIIGPNGAGKTTLLNIVNGFYVPDEGRILFEGKERTRMHPDHVAALGIARTFQNMALFKGMSVLDNISIGSRSRTSESPRRACSHMVFRRGWSWDAPWPQSPNCSSWTNPWQG
jgi:branched-chain amino acid transport system ATP-binding protein